MCRQRLSFVVIIIATLVCYIKSSMLVHSQSQFNVKVKQNKEFNESCLIETFEVTTSGNIAECLKHCLENCLCQSFQICQRKFCQLCSGNKKDNSSLLHVNDSCIYAMFEMKHPTGTLQINEQCSGSCLMKYNCCQQHGVCPKNKICKPINNLIQTSKRFTCECPECYHGDNCDKPITSCQGYSNSSRESGMYKVLGSDKSVYEVYCYFDSRGAWTLVQSYSFANGTKFSNFQEFLRPLTHDHPVSENALTWSGYRLSKRRMKSIKTNSDFIRFTCDHEKHNDINKLDFIQISLTDLEDVDILETHQHQFNRFRSSNYDGKIGNVKFNENCPFSLALNEQGANIHVIYDDARGSTTCSFSPKVYSSEDCSLSLTNYFGNYDSCLDHNHRCSSNEQATTQLWF